MKKERPSMQIEKNNKHFVLSSVLISFLCVFTASFLSSCTSSNGPDVIDSGNAIYDPYEEYNRAVTSFNLAVDRTVVNPVIKGYRTVTPAPARTGLQNVMKNLRSPINLINQLLQGDMDGVGNVLVRAVVNTTIGVGGIFDVAGYEGIPYESEDFGQTLAVWGVGNGPYIVVPFFGASTLRDYGGLFADSMMDPLRWYIHNADKKGLYYAKTGTNYLLLRDSLYDTMTELERSSFDYYAAIRSTYYQYRKGAILDTENRTRNVGYDTLPDIPNFDDNY
ncbi:MAG: VacJ family lipoprotein [Alphaproteobacteria bacterium]|nr:VacJ family lipoprotein [Alphaproteobacteria bacterium]